MTPHDLQNAVTAANVVKKLRKGDSIDDMELAIAIKVIRPLAETLFRFDDRFRLVAVELNNIAGNLEDYQQARKR